MRSRLITEILQRCEKFACALYYMAMPEEKQMDIFKNGMTNVSYSGKVW